MDLPQKKIEEIDEIINSMEEHELAHQINTIYSDMLLHRSVIIGLDIIIDDNKFPYENNGVLLKNREEVLSLMEDVKQHYENSKNKFDILKRYVKNEND